MKKSTFKNLFLIVLFISNSILLFMWWNAPEHRHGGPRNEIIQQLEFTPKQIIKYDQLIKEHRKSIRTLENRISQKKKASVQLH